VNGPPLVSFSMRSLPSRDRSRHAKVGEPVDDGGTDMGFGDLMLEVAREDRVARLFAQEHHVLGDGATAITAVVLSSRAPAIIDGREDGIARVVAAPPYGPLFARDGCLGAAFGNGLMAAVAGFAGVVARDLGKFAVDLPEQFRQNFTVAPVGSGELHADDVLLGRIHNQVNLKAELSASKPKYRYRVTNRAEYDWAMVNRGSLTIWFEEATMAEVRQHGVGKRRIWCQIHHRDSSQQVRKHGLSPVNDILLYQRR